MSDPLSVSCFHLFCFQFAASTHGPLDAISLASEDLAHPGSRQLDNNDNSTDSLLQGGLQHNQDLGARTSAELRPRAASTLDLRASEVGSKSGDLFQSGNLGSPRDKMAAAEMFQTSDLGTSDFSSSELWPSASPSPFDYSQRYRWFSTIQTRPQYCSALTSLTLSDAVALTRAASVQRELRTSRS